jgi:hypothetical protein
VTARLFACLAIFFAAQSTDSQAKKPERVSPKAQNIEVEVARGESVRIPLRGFERNLNPLTYRPLGRPQHGKLSGLEPYNGPERQGPAYITYTHGNDEDSVADTFAFEVKAGTTKLTGRGRVIIKIRDAAPLLSITPELLDFGPVALGDPPVLRVVELANAGGGVITGFLRPTEPFALEDDGGFVLRRGKKTRIPLLFAPERTGEFVFRLQPFANDPALLVLKGLAIPPLVLEVEEAVFSAAPDQSRRAMAVVKNQSARPRTLSVRLPPESPVEAVADFALGPGESTEVILRIPSGRKEYVPPFGVRFESDGHAELREFTAPAIPAALRIVATPDFGAVRPRTVVRASLILGNDGGTPAEGKLLPSESIRPANDATAFTVPPGRELEIPLELRLKPDQAPPTEISVSLSGKEVPIPVTAHLIIPSPTPTPSATPSPTPRPAEFTLNRDIRYETTPEGPAIAWVEKSGWQDFTLQHRTESGGAWQGYQRPAPHEGLIGWLRGLADRIRKFLDTPIERADPTAEPSNEAPAGRQLIAESHLSAANQWRLVATPEGGDKRDVALPFRVRDNTLVGIPAQPDYLPPPPAGPVTAHASAGIKAERFGALLQIAFTRDLGVSGFRLERGAMIAPIDPQTGIPGAPRFKTIDPPEANVEVLGLGEVTAEGRKLTLGVARIDGLPRGTRTYWRVVPTGPSGELAPTNVLLVDTLPVPPFPWRTVAIGALCALLVGVLYLRWRLNRPPC